jgi:predicted transposase YbfD/YdcC
MISAFAARQRVVLGQIKVVEKSNEIVASPKLLDLLAVEGAIVSIDAIGCRRDIAKKILDKQAEYVSRAQRQSKKRCASNVTGTVAIELHIS